MNNIGIILRRNINIRGGRIQKIINTLLKINNVNIVLFDGYSNKSSNIFNHNNVKNDTKNIKCNKYSNNIINTINEIIFNYKVSRRILKKNLKYIIAHDMGNLLGGVLAKKKKNNIILIYDSTELAIENMKGKPIKKWLYGKLEKYMIKYCDYIIHADKYRAIYMNTIYNINNNKSIIIKNLPNKLFNADNIIIRNNNVNVFKTVYLGGIEPRRELDKLVDVFNELPANYYFDIIGGGKKEYINKLKTVIRTDRIKVLSSVKQNEIAEVLQNYDIGFMFYKPDNLNHLFCAPNKLYEYLYSGLCTISYKLPSIEYIIEGNKIGICIEDICKKEIKNAIEEIYNKNYFINISDAIYKGDTWENQEKKIYSIIK